MLSLFVWPEPIILLSLTILTSGRIAEDVVDTKPWYFDDVESLILGSINEAADGISRSDLHVDKTGNDPASAVTVRSPSPSPSLTAIRDLHRRTSHRVSRFSKYLGKDG